MGDGGKHGGKDRKKSKHKKSGKHKSSSHKHKKERRRRAGSGSDSGSSSGSDSDGGGRRLDVNAQLEREREAVRATRALLAAWPAVRADLRQLLWRVDQGHAVGVGGVPDAELAAAIEALLVSLPQLRRAKGQHFLPKGAAPTLSVVGSVFDEPPAPALPARGAAAAGPSGRGAAAGAAAGAPGAARSSSRSPGVAERPPQEAGAGKRDGPAGAKGAAAAAAAAGPVIGPDIGPASGPAPMGGDDRAPGGEGAAEAGPAPGPEQPEPPRRRAVGPAMPAPELLAAAKAYAEELEAAGGYPADDGAASDGDGGDLIGPPPPEYLEADEAAPQDERGREVARVMAALREAAAAAPPAAAGAPPAEPDAYAVLGVEPGTSTADARKRYWKLSLLVHPDKCAAAGAAEAFAAVSKAAATLQDAAARQALDARREDAELRKRALEAATQLERERQWRVARGIEKPGPPVAGSAGAAGPAGREEWMTALPAARSAAGPPSQQSVTSFSRSGVRVRGASETAEWTDTPADRVKRAQGLLTDAMARALPAPDDGGGAPVTREVAAAVAGFNEQRRQKTLMEKHAERLAEDAKQKRKEAKSKKRGAAAPAEGDDWAGKHPWRPFDREKDLGAGLKPRSAADVLKSAGALGSRFGSASGGR